MTAEPENRISPDPIPAIEDGPVAPWVKHEAFAATLAAAAADTWAPAPAIVAFLSLPGPSVEALREWIAEVYHRGFCANCGEPITWGRQRKITHNAACRKARSRKKPSSAELRWVQERKIEDLIRTLGELEFPDWERQERHQKYLDLLAGAHKPKPRLGHAAPKWKGTSSDDDDDQGLSLGDMAGVHVHSSIESVRRHEGLALLDPGDKDANDFLKKHGYGPDGEPRRK